MKIDIITIFPEMFGNIFSVSLIGKARQKKLVDICIHNLRDYTDDKHRIVDDQPYGGGCGMVFKPGPLFKAVAAIKKKRKSGRNAKVIFLSPQGKAFTQQKAITMAKLKNLILICGHYEGIDERVMKIVDEEISIGDYVLTGGEIPAMVLVDAVARMIPGVVKNKDSVIFDSFFKGNILDYPHYTRPAEFRKMNVPGVLLSGNHEKIQQWRLEKALENTRRKRPDLLKK